MLTSMSTFAIMHRVRGLIEIVDGTRADALRAAADLTDGDVWLGEKITGQSRLEPLTMPTGAGYDRFEVFVIPCVKYGGDYAMATGNV